MIYEKLSEAFDFVGVINKERYPNHENYDLLKDVNSIFVVGLAYPNVQLKQEEDRWKVRLIEEEFMQRMWDVEG